MAKLVSRDVNAPWRRRMTLPAYQVKEAARYAGITSQTILNWQKSTATAGAALSARDKGVGLSYLQLVEVAFVAALRNLGVKLEDIRNAHEYMAQKLNAEYPFAQHRFKTDGRDILMELPQFEPGTTKSSLVIVNKGGQTGWAEVLKSKFEEFDYLDDEIAVRWRPAGRDSPIAIDPRVSFGAPTVNGVPTWAIKGRWDAGESLEDISDDFLIDPTLVNEALVFEGLKVKNNNNHIAWRS